MKTEEIIDRLRNPQKYYKMPASLHRKKAAEGQTPVANPSQFSNLMIGGLLLGILGIAAIVLLVTLNIKNQAENITSALDPKNLQGLNTSTDFNPHKDVTYVQVFEGQDRNVAVDQLGTTLPVVTRFNYQAITPANYGVIGMAPWALTQNLTANLQDTELIRYLLNREEVAKAFVQRTDVAPLLSDPQLLSALAQDNANLNEFFSQETVQEILANPALVRAIAGSRFMSYLLTSKAVKYYRDHPQEAAQLISSSPVLTSLRQNQGIRQAVEENYYLKKIAKELLGAQASYAPATPPRK